jgi:hypothetical protein
MRKGIWVATLILWLVGLSEGHAAKITLPVDVGVGPAVHLISGQIQQDQQIHTGLVFSLQAVIDKQAIKKYANKIPKKYRQAAKSMTEVRVSPSIFIPDTIFISPKVENTGIYGISWAPTGVSVPLVKGNTKVTARAGLRLTYAYIDSDTLGTTHFLRPGIDPGISAEIPLSKKFLFSAGWESQIFVPQKVGGDVYELGNGGNSIWHIGRAHVKLHYRFPYKMNI